VVVGGTGFISFLEDWNNKGFFPIWWYCALIDGCLGKCCEGFSQVWCKLFEKSCWIICSSVAKHLETHGILNDAQHGFRKNRSWDSQLILTIQDLAKGIVLGEQIDLILLDFSKAFDKVPREITLQS
jgi:hypothetical protein